MGVPRFVGFISLFLLFGIACSPRPETLTIIHSTPPLTMDPDGSMDLSTHVVLYNVYEGLAGYDERGQLIPVLAESWATPSPTEWVFTIRKGVEFHDGGRLTSDDAVGSITRLTRSRDPLLKEYAAMIAGCRATGPGALRIRTGIPDGNLLHCLAAVKITRGGRSDGAGTGPYRIESKGDSEIVLARFPGYRERHPSPKRVRFLYEPDEERRMELAAENIPFILLDFTRSRGNIAAPAVIRTRVSETVTYLGFNITIQPFARLSPWTLRSHSQKSPNGVRRTS